MLLQSIAAIEDFVTNVTEYLAHQVLTLHMLTQIIRILHFVFTIHTLPHL